MSVDVFVLMPFAETFDWLHDEIVAAGKQVGAAVERADDIFEAGTVIDQVRERILTSDAIVAVCTGRNANVFFELGIAEQVHKPILVAERADDLPFDVQHFRAQIYGTEEDAESRATFKDRLARAITDTVEARRRNLPTVMGQSMMHVEVAGLERKGSYERVPVDVVELLREVKGAGDRGLPPQDKLPDRQPMLGRPWTEVSTLAQSMGLLSRVRLYETVVDSR